MLMPERFHIDVSEGVLEDLRRRVDQTRWPDPVRNSGWEYGTDLGTLQQLVSYWQEKYDWREEEAKLNSFPQFRIKLEGLNIHFVHLRSENPDAIPLVITHG